MYSDPNMSSLVLQVFAATLGVLTGIAFALSRQAKTVKVRVRRYNRNAKHEQTEE